MKDLEADIAALVSGSLTDLQELWGRIGYTDEEQEQQKRALFQATRHVFTEKYNDECRIEATFQSYSQQLQHEAKTLGPECDDVDGVKQALETLEAVPLADKILRLEQLVDGLRARRPNAVPGGGGGDGIAVRHQAWRDQRSDPAPGAAANTSANSGAGAGTAQLFGAVTDGADMHPQDQLGVRGPADPGSGDMGSSGLADGGGGGGGEGGDAGNGVGAAGGGGEANGGRSGAVVDSPAAGDDSAGEELSTLMAQDTAHFAETLTELRDEGCQLLEELCVTSGAMEIDSWFHINRPLEDASANVLNAAFVAQVRARVVELHEDIQQLWDELNVPDKERHAFSSSVHSLSEDTLHAGEKELARLRAQMGTYQDSKRLRELMKMAMLLPRDKEKLNKLMLDYEQGIASKHDLEDECANLSKQVEMSRKILTTIQEREKLVAFRLKHASTQRDPARLKTKNFRELRDEEIMEKKVKNDLPTLNQVLEKRLTQWEKDHRMDFVVNGSRYLDVLREQEDTWRAHQTQALMQRKLARKKSSDFQLLSPGQRWKKAASSVIKAKSEGPLNGDGPTPRNSMTGSMFRTNRRSISMPPTAGGGSGMSADLTDSARDSGGDLSQSANLVRSRRTGSVLQVGTGSLDTTRLSSGR